MRKAINTSFKGMSGATANQRVGFCSTKGIAPKPAMGMAKWLYAVCVAGLLSACGLQNIDDIQLENRYVANFALPLGQESLTIDEIIETGRVEMVAPDAVPSGTNMFIANGSYYKTPISYDTLVSLEFNMDETVDLIDDIQNFVLRVNAINRTHATLKLQIYFRGDEWGTAIDSAFLSGPITIQAGKIIAGNQVEPYSFWRHDEAFSHERVVRFNDVTHLDIKASFIFPKQNLPVVSFVDNEVLWIQLGFRAGIDLDPNEL